MTVTQPEQPASDVLRQIRKSFPDTPFLALGQSVFWDEPMKATLRRLLDINELGGQMILGVHDTDYFAKSRVSLSGGGKFALMAHNDGTTKDLWSAAGEVSTLFGSETFPGKHLFSKYGAPFERVARASDLGRQGFIDEMTEAWGWRGLVYTGSRDLIVNALSLREVGDGIMEMLEWGFANALPQIIPGCCQDKAKCVTEQIMGWCQEYRSANPEKTLTDLFQHCLPRLHELLLGHAPANSTVTSTTQLLNFTPDKAHLARFKFVDLFLNPDTRELALSAYNRAIAGSEMYTLDKFGTGALPFDIITPEYGRGTLRVTPKVVFVETKRPIAIGLKQPITNIHELAEVLHRKLGESVTLVGKAVSLVSMLAQEFIFVFNEEGSLYVRRTRQMNDTLLKAGVALNMHPILRMRYETWSSLSVGTSTLRLPEHLTQTFGRRDITTPEFASEWRATVEAQGTLCSEISKFHKPIELMKFLALSDPANPWEQRIAEYENYGSEIETQWSVAKRLRENVKEKYQLLKSSKLEEQEIHTLRGTLSRDKNVDAVSIQKYHSDSDKSLSKIQDTKTGLKSEIRELKEEALLIEQSPIVKFARNKRVEIENQAELSRIKLIQSAVLTADGLTHTNHRPSAWWIPLLDNSGNWFDRIVQTTSLYLEPLVSEPTG